MSVELCKYPKTGKIYVPPLSGWTELSDMSLYPISEPMVSINILTKLAIQPVCSTLIGRDLTRLGSHWSIAS